MDSKLTRTAGRPRVAGTRIGPFVIDRLLGGGADTEVWRADGDGIIVALKLARNPLDPLSVARLAHEALALELVQHPSVVHRFDADSTDGEAWLATALHDGGTLGQRLDDGLLDVAPAAATLAPIADALAVAHRAGVVHRDVNPANVLLPAEGPLLIDFGHASINGRTWDGWTDTGAVAVARTEGYAPADRVVSDAVDIFGLGVTLLEAVAGVRTLDALTSRRQRERAVPIADLVAACCAPDPAHRPDAASVAAAIRRLAGDAPPATHPAATVIDLIRAEHADAVGAAGRTAELQRLAAVVRTATAADEFGGILVVASAGSGKSWLLETALAAAHGAGTTTRITRCTETIGDLRALRPILEPDLGDARLGATDVARLRSAIGVGDGPQNVTTRDIVESLTALLRLRPIVIVIDDLHWAHPQLIELLSQVAFRSGVPGAMFLGTRPGFLDPDDIGVETLALGPLDDEALRGAVIDIVGGEHADAAVALAAGNPLHAREAARALAAGIDLDAGADLRSVVGARLAAADPQLRPALALAAASGDGFWPEVVGDELLDGLPALVRTGYARARIRSSLAGTTEFEWAHPLLREVAYARLTELDLRVLHGRLARRFDERADVDSETIAHHAGVAFRFGDDAIGPLTARHATASVRAALDHYAVPRAAEWVDLIRDTAREVDLVDVLDAEVKNRQGDFTSALHLLLPHADRDDDLGTRVLMVGAESLVGTGDYQRAAEWGAAARARLRDRPLEQLRTARPLARALQECGSLDLALQVLDDAERDARALGAQLLAVELASAAIDVCSNIENQSGLGPTKSIERARRIAAELRGLGDRRGLIEFAATTAADAIGIEDPAAALAIQRAAFDAAAVLDDPPARARGAFRLVGAAFDAEEPAIASEAVALLRDPPVDAATAARMQILAESYAAAMLMPFDADRLDRAALQVADIGASADSYIAVAVHLWSGDTPRAARMLERVRPNQVGPSAFDLLARLQLAILSGPPFEFDGDFPDTTAFHPERAVLAYLRGDRLAGDALTAERDSFLRATGNLRQSFGVNFTQRLMAAAGSGRSREETSWIRRQLTNPPFPGIWRVHRVIVALILAERRSDVERTGDFDDAAGLARALRGRVDAAEPVRIWLDERLERLS
jgi:hypothetical protein